MFKKLFRKKEKEICFVFNSEEVNLVSALLKKEIDKLENKINYDVKESKTYNITKRYYSLLADKKVIAIPFRKSDREDLLFLVVLIMVEANNSDDPIKKHQLNLIAARIQSVHRELGE